VISFLEPVSDPRWCRGDVFIALFTYSGGFSKTSHRVVFRSGKIVSFFI